jgi:hypothetical protein
VALAWRWHRTRTIALAVMLGCIKFVFPKAQRVVDDRGWNQPWTWRVPSRPLDPRFSRSTRVPLARRQINVEHGADRRGQSDAGQEAPDIELTSLPSGSSPQDYLQCGLH